MPAIRYWLEANGQPPRLHRLYASARAAFDSAITRVQNQGGWVRLIEEADTGHRREVAWYERRTK
jgi:hypothetical protein